MKKLIQLSTFFCLSIHGLNYSIENKTDGQIHILLEYEANSLCTPAERIITTNQTITIKSGLCHAQQITIQGFANSFQIQKQIKKKDCESCTIRIIQENPTSGSCSHPLNILVLISYQSH